MSRQNWTISWSKNDSNYLDVKLIAETSPVKNFEKVEMRNFEAN